MFCALTSMHNVTIRKCEALRMINLEINLWILLILNDLLFDDYSNSKTNRTLKTCFNGCCKMTSTSWKTLMY
jgi:hypothetical protein